MLRKFKPCSKKKMAKSKAKSDFFTCIFQGFYCVIDFPISVENHINC